MIRTFKRLWQNGLDAELEMKTKTGQVSISLSLILDNKLRPTANCNLDVNLRSRDRRRLRRAAQCQYNVSEGMNHNGLVKESNSVGETPIIASRVDAENGSTLDSTGTEEVIVENNVTGVEETATGIIPSIIVENTPTGASTNPKNFD